MRLLIKVSTILLIFIVLGLAMGWTEYQRFVTTPLTVGDEGYTFTITPGTNLGKISKQV